MATTTSAPALDLATQHDRPIIKIDGVPYEVRVLDDLTFVDMNHIDRVRPRIEELGDKLRTTTGSDAEMQELSRLLVEACTVAVAAPSEVLAKLSDIGKLQVFKVFHERLLPAFLTVSAGLQPTSTASGSSGTKSSPDSNGSTATRLPPGKRGRRSATSARV